MFLGAVRCRRLHISDLPSISTSTVQSEWPGRARQPVRNKSKLALQAHAIQRAPVPHTRVPTHTKASRFDDTDSATPPLSQVTYITFDNPSPHSPCSSLSPPYLLLSQAVLFLSFRSTAFLASAAAVAAAAMLPQSSSDWYLACYKPVFIPPACGF